MTTSQHVPLFFHYFTHNFHYYAHYFQCLCRIRLVEIVNSTLQLKVQRLFEQLQAKESTDKFVSLSEGDRQCSFEAIISIILLLFYYYSDYFSYYTHYSQNKNGVACEYLLRKSASKLSRGGTEAGNHHSAGAQAGNHP